MCRLCGRSGWQRIQFGLIIRFPPRRTAAIFVCKDGDEWLALARGHGWSFSSRSEALNEAQWLSRNLGLPICVIDGCLSNQEARMTSAPFFRLREQQG
jgi:hypothetical protein